MEGMEFKKIILLPLLFITSLVSSQELGNMHINAVDELGRKQGEWTVYDGYGGLKYKGTYVDGKPKGKFIYYYPTGEIQAEVKNIDLGKVRYVQMFHANGKLMAEGKYVNQTKDSIWNYYNGSDGSLSLVEYYENAVRQGEWKTYYPSGQVMEIIPYKDGRKQGSWIQYFTDGNIKAKGTYKDDKMDGLYVLNHLNGNVEVSGTYQNDQKDGIWVYLNEIGELQKKEIYKSGVLISKEDISREEDNN
jgi:antitoxin component YwqK of YwqJK toxin-antitoxin module